MKLDVRGLAEVQDRLAKLKARTLDLTPVLVVAEEILKKTSSDAFRGEINPNTGKAWDTLSEKYYEYKKNSRAKTAKKKATYSNKILVWNSVLKNSITATNNKKDTVLIGTNTVYAATHQFGRGKIPARPFLPTAGAGEGTITGKAITKIRALLAKYIATGSVG